MNILGKRSKNLCLFLVAAALLFFAPALSTAEEIQLEKMRPFHIEPRTVINVDTEMRTIRAETTPGAGDGIPATGKYADPYLAVSIFVKKGEVVRVTFAGSMRGNVYGAVLPDDPSGHLNFRGLNNQLTGLQYGANSTGQHEWRPYYATYICRAYEDDIFTFKHVFEKKDFRPWVEFKPNRIAIAEIITTEFQWKFVEVPLE